MLPIEKNDSEVWIMTMGARTDRRAEMNMAAVMTILRVFTPMCNDEEASSSAGSDDMMASTS